MSPLPASSLNYISQIRHLNIAVDAMVQYTTLSPDEYAIEQSYFLSDEFNHHCLSYHISPAYANILYPKQKLFQLYRQVLLYREVTWTLASPILKQLQSLTIPVSDIKRYAEVVFRMESLEHIRFLLDEVWTHPVITNSDTAAETLARKDEVLQSIIRFVQNHTRLFPKRLRMVSSCNRDRRAAKSSLALPQHTQLTIFQLLPPAQRLVSLTENNWMQLMAHPESTDLRYLRTLRHNGPPEAWFDQRYDYRLLLQRCRALRDLHVAAMGQGSFAWAVQEKRSMESLEADIGVNFHKRHGTVGWKDKSLPDYQQYGLVPLRTFTISEHLQPLTDEIDDVAFAFSSTLTRITASTLGDSIEGHWIHIGRGWVDLPILTLLDIQIYSSRLIIHPELLTHCPSLSYVKLADRTYGYRCQDIVPCQAAQLPNLKTLTLVGWSALTFHHATLHSTSTLIKLNITMDIDADEGCFIPPPAELKWSYGIEDDSRLGTEFQDPPPISRPRWTWDWYLPHLCSLRLTAEFAYHFQFQMLPGCPSLNFLSLDIHSIDNDSLIMIEEDLLARSIRGDPTSPLVRIAVPTLRHLNLRGRWIMNDGYMFYLMSHMFPNVEDWVLDGWEDITLRGLVGVLRNQPNNRYHSVYTSLALPTEAEKEELGIVLDTSVADRGTVLNVTVYFYDGPYGEIISVCRLLRVE
ncbi:hypothetical protein BGZ95_002299 [Linnemannia exigua]|uniref:F-box domain-containing protein n=1 Tax=Linnemannia exigua TaxID=604196 RepID=A0AAD4D5Q4_9FUNG|nr:hypothetical protein BGZ95_002299 [Linnemannia exigua]